MADLIDGPGGLTDTLTVHAPSDALSFVGNLQILVDAMGSRRAAGRLLGIGESTLRGWQRGVKPRRDINMVQWARAAAGEAYRPGLYGEAYSGAKTLVVHGVVANSGDVRVRTIYPGRYIPRQSMQYILRAWSRGDDATANRVLNDAIGKWYEGCDVQTMTGVWFE